MSVLDRFPGTTLHLGQGRPQPRCNVAQGNLSNIGKPNSYGHVPYCMEFDSGGNGVRFRTGKTLGLGKASLIGARRDSNVSLVKDKNQNQRNTIFWLSTEFIRIGISYFFPMICS